MTATANSDLANIHLGEGIRYGLSRNVSAMKNGQPVLICLAYITFPNGEETTLAIPEEEIRFKGAGIIEQRIKQAAR